jgi:hypothetical protein
MEALFSEYLCTAVFANDQLKKLTIYHVTIFSQSRRLSILLPPSLLSSLSFRSWKKPVRSLTTVLIGSMSLLQLVLQSVLLLLASLEFISSRDNPDSRRKFPNCGKIFDSSHFLFFFHSKYCLFVFSK